MPQGQRRPLVAGNWKMNGLKSSAAEFGKMLDGAKEVLEKADLLVCPPVTLVMACAAHAHAHGSKVAVGGQDCHVEAFGAFTGDYSAEMLADLGATACIVGHSERRTTHHETNTRVRSKAEAAWRAGLMAIVCVGETKDERASGRTLDIIRAQIAISVPDNATAQNVVVAYEPVWAIGTGVTPTPDDVAQVLASIRERLRQRFPKEADGMRILYGGSVKPANARELLSVDNVDGALVGGASLKADDFLGIAKAYV